MIRPSTFEVVVLASTGDDVASFGPYVPAMAEDGSVAFTAKRADGRTSVVIVDPHGHARDVPGLDSFTCTSHPDRDESGRVVVYAEDRHGATCLVRVEPGHRAVILARAGERGLLGVGPLGPTVDARGAVAFRADTASGPAILVLDAEGHTRTVASRADGWASFQGLPVFDGDEGGDVVVRADEPAASVVLRVSRGGASRRIVTAPRGALGAFPSVSADGALVTAAREGGMALLRVAPDGDVTVLVGPPVFSQVRGALPGPDGRVVFYATRADATGADLTIFTGRDPDRDRVLGIGSALAGSAVTGFALNPVSINARGQVAARVELADGRELVVRFDLPASATLLAPGDTRAPG